MKAYIFAGLPGSGKSTAADIASKITGGDIIRAGSMIREMARDDGITNPTSEELANYAASQREEHGPGFFGEQMVDLLEGGEVDPEQPVLIDSCRHRNGVAEFQEYFDTAPLVWVSAPQSTRLYRLQHRGREDEGEFDMSDLIRRDSVELEELGQATIRGRPIIDHRVENTGTLEDLKDEVERIL